MFSITIAQLLLVHMYTSTPRLLGLILLLFIAKLLCRGHSLPMFREGRMLPIIGRQWLGVETFY